MARYTVSRDQLTTDHTTQQQQQARAGPMPCSTVSRAPWSELINGTQLLQLEQPGTSASRTSIAPYTSACRPVGAGRVDARPADWPGGHADLSFVSSLTRLTR